MPKRQGRRKQWSGATSPARKPSYSEHSKSYGEQRTKPDERPKKRNRQKRTHKVRGRRRQRPKTSSLMRTRLESEERLKASEDAAKNQGGFGSRLRSWFGHKPPNP